MGKRGPLPNPDSLRSRRGANTLAAAGLAAITPGTVAPARCPRWLHPIGKRLWKQLAPELESKGLLNCVYETAFASLCQSYARAVEAEQDLQKKGMLLQGPRGKTYVNPSYRVYKTYLPMYLQFAKDFGLTPVSRARLVVPEKPEEKDPLDDLLKRRMQ